MAKKGSKKRAGNSSREARVQTKIAKAREELQRIQEKRTYVMRKGEDDVEQARATASKRLTAVTSRLEKRAASLARLEDQLRVNQSERPTMRSRHDVRPVIVPGVGADVANQPDTGVGPSIIVPDSASKPPDSHEQNSTSPESDGAHS